MGTRQVKLQRRRKRTYKEMFLAKLSELSGNEQKIINNVTLRKALRWEQKRYDGVKDALQAVGAINAGLRGGPGGAVSLAEPPGGKKRPGVKLFISYSHCDEQAKNELCKHLSPLKRMGLISADWHDRKIQPGDKWEPVISENLKTADIIIFVVSIDFINSNYCYDIEMEAALDRAADGAAIVVPVIARSCMWKNTKFGPFQALPTDGKAITTWEDQDEALSIVAEGIQKVAERLLSQR
jgi:hypothetical protein